MIRPTRVVELLLSLGAFGLAGLTIWLIADGARSGEITWTWTIANWGVAFLMLLLVGTVIALGLRLAFPPLRTQGRVVSRAGLLAFSFVWICLLVRAWIADGRFPPAALAPIAGAIIGYAYVRSRGPDA